MPAHSVADLLEIHAIEELKYRYARCLDLKQWDELRTLFADDAVCDYSGGKYHQEGADAIVEWIKNGMGAETFLSSHKMHHPEITITGSHTAVGIWALDDRVIMSDLKLAVRGASFYDDRYVKLDGEWKFAYTSYRRVYEEIEPRPDLNLTASWWATDGQSSLPA
jgi:SnoaL-like domain